MTYDEFLAGKVPAARPSGFDVDVSKLNPKLFDWQREIVKWSCRLGKSAIFADCGLGKTAMQLTWADEVCKETGGDVLILAPLAVAKQTKREGDKFGVHVTVCRSQSDVQAGVNVANYEMLQHFDTASFAGVVLDESSILKSHDGQTRQYVTECFVKTPYRMCCTATPSPNDHMELGNHAEFLGTMSRAEMLAMYFTHDGGETSKWRLKEHGRQKFWQWVASWALMIRNPSDIGYPSEGYDLPQLKTHTHIIDGTDDASNGKLFASFGGGLNEARAARKSSINSRVAKIADMVNASGAQWLVWCDLNAESDALASSILDAEQVQGSDTTDHKESAMERFTSGELRVLVTKPSIAGFGMNWQNCHNIAFCGISHSYEQFYQAVRRCWRFGQLNAVDCHVVLSDNEMPVWDNVKKKGDKALELSQGMIAESVGFAQRAVSTTANVAKYAVDDVEGNGWKLMLGDCVERTAEIASDSIGLSVFSPPFASLYTYSNSERDMGNCSSDEDFAVHFSFLIDELYRITMPGRHVCFHCMNLPTSKERDGVIGIRDFRGELIRAFVDKGFIYHSEVCIWKDPVTAMQRTKALGLLHKQLKKDSCMSRQGIPDYVVTMRKPGDNPERVTHTNESFPVSEWQQYASPVWMDVNMSRTLNKEGAKEFGDERHICPLQLDVIDRCVRLWSNPGDTVFSPFAGIGSEGHSSLLAGRQFLGIELKRSYFDIAVQNLEKAVIASTQSSLFDAA